MAAQRQRRGYSNGAVIRHATRQLKCIGRAARERDGRATHSSVGKSAVLDSDDAASNTAALQRVSRARARRPSEQFMPTRRHGDLRCVVQVRDERNGRAHRVIDTANNAHAVALLCSAPRVTLAYQHPRRHGNTHAREPSTRTHGATAATTTVPHAHNVPTSSRQQWARARRR
jgi:hypothetical protein